MVSFRPHTIVGITPNGHYNDIGDYISDGETTTSPIPCRYVPNGAANTIRLDDGSEYLYAYTVCLDLKGTFKVGQKVELFNEEGDSIGRFTVKGYHKYQLHSTLWI